MDICRFAPTTSGRAHPGTLLAGLLAWLDARRSGTRLLLRLEDLDPERCRPEFATGLIDDLAWLGLDWDAVERQSEHAADHAAALDRLATAGRLYPSQLSRRELAALGRRAPDGAWAYDNRERGRSLADWRRADQPLRCRLDDGALAISDLGGEALDQDPAAACGDPVVRRRDGVTAYCLAVVVDDARAGITRVVRGRDIAPATATQVALGRLLGLTMPAYRHHLLLWEGDDRKLSKCHGSVSAPELRRCYAGPELCGFLAWCAGLIKTPEACTPGELLPGFSWERVRREDLAIRWDGHRLTPWERCLQPASEKRIAPTG